jgi:hypothetical protein
MTQVTRKLIYEMARDVVARARTELRHSPPAPGQDETCYVGCSELALHIIEGLETWAKRHGIEPT